MGNGYDHHSLHLHRHHHRHFHPKTIFLPMLCRLSIKDILSLNHHRRNNNHPISAADDPSSPKVGCMGQVKRNNRATHPHHRYSKLKRLFSGKTILPPTTASGGAKTRSSSFRFGGGEVRVKDQKKHKVVNIGEIDPPLPVVKRASPPGAGGDEAASLWRRRFNGAAELKGLQIEQIITRLPNSNNVSCQPPTV